MSEIGSLVAGTLLLRPYVFAFLAAYLLAAVAAWGWRRAAAFTVLGGALAFAAEWTSTRAGIPFGLYHYTGVTRGRELYLGNVPCFDPLSFTFLAYASLQLARLLLGRDAAAPDAARPARERRLPLALLAGTLMMWLDLVIDPLAVRGERWFLGRVFYYPEPGPYFGVPLANFVGWAALGALIAGVWLWLAPRLAGAPPAWAGRLPGRGAHGPLLYYAVLLFNLTLTGLVAETALFWAGVALHLPLLAAVVCCVAFPDRSATRSLDAGELA